MARMASLSISSSRRGAAAHVTTPGASCVYRAGPGLGSRDHVTLNVAADGYLEYLPEPRILFPDAALEQSLEIECSPGGVALVSDAFTVHDPTACGRGFRRLRTSTILRCHGELALADRSDIDSLEIGATTGFAAFASIVLAAPGRLGHCTVLAEELTRTFDAVASPYCAASLLPAKAGVGVRLCSARPQRHTSRHRGGLARHSLRPLWISPSISP